VFWHKSRFVTDCIFVKEREEGKGIERTFHSNNNLYYSDINLLYSDNNLYYSHKNLYYFTVNFEAQDEVIF
jgi:hypothetical protein